MAAKNLLRYSIGFGLLLCYGSLFHRLYYRRFKVKGKENIPRGTPIIFAANHQNGLMDAMAVIFASRRQIVFLARADIFRKKTTARLLNFIKILPVYRIRDGYSTLGQNQETFSQVYDILRHRRSIGIFPEGEHLGKKMLKPLRKGTARMALQAEEEAGFKLGLQIVPTGIDYSDYYNPGGDLLVIFGKPILVASYQDVYRDNPTLAILQLRDDLAKALREIMIDIPSVDYPEILEKAEKNADIVLKKQHLPKNLYNRFLVIKQLTDEMSSQTHQPATMHPANTIMHPASRILNLLIHTLFFPFFVYGYIINILPAYLAKRFSRKVADPHLKVSVRFGAGFFLFNTWYFILAVAAILLLSDPLAVLATILTFPLSALLAFYYRRACYLKRSHR